MAEAALLVLGEGYKTPRQISQFFKDASRFCFFIITIFGFTPGDAQELLLVGLGHHTQCCALNLVGHLCLWQGKYLLAVLSLRLLKAHLDSEHHQADGENLS